MVATTTFLSADDYLATDRERPRFTELIHGEVFLNTPSLRPQRIGARIQFLLQLWCEQAPGRGEAPLSVDAKLSDGDVYAPDVWWGARRIDPHATRSISLARPI